MDVTERTVRRDISKLRDLGYAIDSDPGPWGGYRLGGGGAKVPPLSLDDEEALAVAVALREAALSGVLGTDQAALSALLKLQRLLPPHIADRLGALGSAFVHTPRSDERQVSPGVLLELATACRSGERVRLSFRDRLDRGTVRDVDPYRLVHTGHRWYLVALEVVRGEWRTFRADRVTEARPTGHLTELADPPDAALVVSRMLTSDYPSTRPSDSPFPWTGRCCWSPTAAAPIGPTAATPPSSPSAAPAPRNSPTACSASRPPCGSCRRTTSAAHCAAARRNCSKATRTTSRRNPRRAEVRPGG
jgi:hypothetical protein